jgi:hypothetical protein
MYFSHAQDGLLRACDEAPKSWDKLTKIRDTLLQGLPRIVRRPRGSFQRTNLMMV